MADKFKLQEGLSVDGDNLQTSRDYDRRLQELGRTLVAGLYMLIRNVKLYDPDNVIFARPLEQIQNCINTIIALDGSLNLQAAGEAFYLNNMLVRMDLKSTENMRTLLAEFESHNVGGFVLEQSINVDELRNLIFIFSRDNRESAGEHGVSARKLQAIKLRRFEKIKEIMQAQDQMQDDEQKAASQTLDRKRYGLVVYARAVMFMRKYFEGLRGDGPDLAMGKVNHVIQDLVDVCHEHKTHFLGVSSVDKGEEYLPFHAVNTAVLAIVFAAELGLPKARLRELGIVSLFHEIGMADQPDELLYARGKLSEDLRAAQARTPMLTALRLLRGNPLNMRTIQCAITAFDHMLPFGRPVKDQLGKLHHLVQVNDLSVFARVVAIADCYDELVSRKALSPEIALTLMNSELVWRFDPLFLKHFSHLMKGYTAKVLAGTGEKLELF